MRPMWWIALLSCGAPGPDVVDDTATGALVELGPEKICTDPEARAILGPFWQPELDPAWTEADALVPPEAQTEGAKIFGDPVAVGDLDGDGHRDIFLPNIALPQLFLGDGAGGFVDGAHLLPAQWDIEHPIQGLSVELADLDGDGDLDLYLGRAEAADELWWNLGDGRLEQALGTGFGTTALAPRAISWGDVDGDGDLDLSVGNDTSAQVPPEPGDENTLWLQVEPGRFEDVSDRLPLPVRQSYTKNTPLIDVDGDGDQDMVLIAHLDGPNRLLLNDGSGSFTESPESGLNELIHGMGFDAADLNDDGLPDMLVAGTMQIALYMSLEPGRWYRADIAQGLVLDGEDKRVTAWSSVFADLENDGHPEIVSGFAGLDHGPSAGEVPDQPDGVWRWIEGQGWSEESALWGLDQIEENRAVAVVDLDQDGWLDVVKSARFGGTRVWMARCGEAAWTRVRLRGLPGNAEGIGARVTVRSRAGTQRRWIVSGGSGTLVSIPHEAHFGLGDATVLEELEIRWPDGTVQNFSGLSINRFVTVMHPG